MKTIKHVSDKCFSVFCMLSLHLEFGFFFCHNIANQIFQSQNFLRDFYLYNTLVESNVATNCPQSLMIFWTEAATRGVLQKILRIPFCENSKNTFDRTPLVASSVRSNFQIMIVLNLIIFINWFKNSFEVFYWIYV